MPNDKPLPPMPKEVREALDELREVIETFSVTDADDSLSALDESLWHLSAACSKHELIDSDGRWRTSA